MPAHALRILGRCVDPRTNRSRAHVDLANEGLRFAEPVDILEHRVREGVELLAERHRDGILKLSAPHLDERAELLALVQKRRGQRDHRQLQVPDTRVKRELHRGRINVVGRLAEIDVVVRVNDVVLPALLAEDLERAIGHHFVCVHVRRSSGAALDHVDPEMLVMQTFPDLAGRL